MGGEYSPVAAAETDVDSPDTTLLANRIRNNLVAIMSGWPILNSGFRYYLAGVWYYDLDGDVAVLSPNNSTQIFERDQVWIPAGVTSLLAAVRGWCDYQDVDHRFHFELYNKTTLVTYDFYEDNLPLAEDNFFVGMSGLTGGAWYRVRIYARREGTGANSDYFMRNFLLYPAVI